MHIVILDNMHPILTNGLKAKGYKVDYLPEGQRNDLLDMGKDVQGLVLRSKLRVDQALVDALPRLRFVARAGAGIDMIDQRLLQERGIALLHASEGNRDAVAEHMTGMLLALVNNLCRGHQEVVQGQWRREANRGFELAGRTATLIGYGHNGQAMARRLKALGMQVQAIDPYQANWPSDGALAVDWERAFTNTDVLSLHVPLTEETMQMITYTTITRFQQPFWLLNGSRGAVVHLDAVLKAIQSGALRGAALDVQEKEQPDSWSASYKNTINQLQASQKVLFSPHVAGWSHESHERISQVLLQKMGNLLGQPDY